MGMVRKGSMIVAMAVLSLSLGSAAMAADAAKPKPPKKMVINGISSGVLRVPEVAVWSCAGGQMGGCSLMGKLKHGTEVMRHEAKRLPSGKWYHVVGGGMDGWILDTFLKTPGT